VAVRYQPSSDDETETLPIDSMALERGRAGMGTS
jgi:hypothetical protein